MTRNKLTILIFLVCLQAVASFCSSPTPIVIWHGMGDSCCNPLSIGKIIKVLKQTIPGVYVYSIDTGKGFITDTLSGFKGNVNSQVTDVCNIIKNDVKLKFGYHAVGFSQGSQFLRAVAQRCSSPEWGFPPMLNLVGFGAQHQGIYGLPHCISNSFFCEQMRKLLDLGAYESFVQREVIQAQYWHDPIKPQDYKKFSIFLADINQENNLNETYRKNLKKLHNLVMVKFLQDTMVVPKESSWFGFYKNGQNKEVVPLNETRLYMEDRLGLKYLDKRGKLHFLSYDSDHLQFDLKWFTKQIIRKFLM